MFELRANLVVEDLGPVYLRPREGQLSTERLERRVRHRLVVLGDGSLILVFGILHDLHKLLGSLLLTSDREGRLDLLRTDQLDVAVLVIVNLNFDKALHVS